MSLSEYLKKVKATKAADKPPIQKIIAETIPEIQDFPKPKKWLLKFKAGWAIFAGVIFIVLSSITIYETWFKPDDKIKQGTIESPKLSNKSYTALKDQPSFIFNTKDYRYPLIKGILIDSLSKMNKRDWVAVLIGGNMVAAQIGSLYQGIDVLNPSFSDCSNSVLGLIANGDRLYVWAKIIDLRTQDLIGEIAWNHWKLYKDTYLHSNQNDSSFEVIDHQGYVVFSIAYRARGGAPIVSISGYFNSPTSVLVVDNAWHSNSLDGGHYIAGEFFNCFRKSEVNWMRNAQIEIAKIRSVF